MEWKSNLSTTVSCDQPTWIQTGLQNRKTTVSQLVARYQITNVSSGIQENVEKKEEAKPKQIPQALLETKESQLEALGRRNDKKDQSPERTSLVRSKSMGSLQSNNGSIEARKARFESKAAAENKAKSSFGAKRNQSSNKMADIDQVVNGEVEEMSQALLESKESHADTLRRGNGAKDQSPDKTSLVRSKSMASLQSNAGSIEARMFQFESKAAAQNSVKTNKQSPKKSTDITQLMNGDAEQISQSPPESKEAHLEASGKRNEEKEQSWVKTSLVHAKSMGSPQSNAGSIEALMARFESKAAAQNKVKRVLNIQPSSKSKDVVQNIQGETEDIKNPREKRKTHMAVNASVDEGKKDPTSQKVANRTRRERRKTIGGIDFEKMVASLIDEKRRSLVDFRDKETLSVSVKAISALYLSKVAPQEPTNRLSKPAHDQSSRSGRTVKLFKMAEDPQQKAGIFHPAVSSRNHRGPEYNHEALFQQSITSQVSKEKLYEQRQKCELKRLLKHTHPELKVDDVEEELAEVLNSDTAWATGETGYEGEVYSRCLIFENRAFSDTSPKQTAVRSDDSTILTVESVEDDALVSNAGCEEELKSIDVQAARRIFEIQSENTSRLYPAKLQKNVPLSGNEAKQDNKNKTLLKRDKNNGGTRSPPHPESTDQELSGMEANHSGETVTEDETSLHDAETSGDTIKTSAALYKNNPFISTNIERERSFVHTSNPQCAAGDSRDAPACLQANVKERAYLFESLPFDKIRNQNKDEIETMVENIRETLSSLYHANAIHSHGSIIEVNETMKAKKAQFTILDGQPVVQYNEVTEGGAQNFILQLIPRVNLKPQITYLKEDNKGSVTATIVNVQFHQHRFTSDHDTEFKTTHLVQVVEDILNQDNSLRKGVIIQEDVGASPDVIVYSLYNYFDEGNVKSYCPPQRTGYDELQPGGSEMSKTSNQELTEREGESAINSHLDTPKDPNCTGPMKPEIKVKGHVKLFTSCIEKGDFECLRSFQAESIVQDQELERPITEDVAGQVVEIQQDSRSNQTEVSEWIPVDVKKLKNIFSGDQKPTQPEKNQCEALAQSTTSACTGPNGPLRKNQSCAESNTSVFFQQQLKDNFRPQKPENTCVHLETQDNERARKAELVEVVDDNDEISNLKIAINTLQKVTLEAKTLQERQKSLVQEPSKNPFVVVAMGDIKQIEIETPQGNVSNKATPSKNPRSQEFLSNTDIPCEGKLDLHRKTTKDCQKETVETFTEMGQNSNSASVHGSEMVPAQLEGEEVFQGTLQAALKSLERSNINVTRGDFKAAMIYRNSSKSHKERSPNVDVSAREPTKEDICPFPPVKSSQANQREEVSEAKADLSRQSKPLNKAATGVERDKKHVGTKPAIPPKPEHLKGKQRDIQSSDTKNPKNKIPKEKVHCYEMSGPNSLTFRSKVDAVVPMCQEAEMSQVQASIITLESDKTDETVSNQQQESHNLESAKSVSVKNVPVKPKRVKSAQPDHKNPNSPILSEPIPILHGSSRHNPNTNENADSNEKNNITMTQESKVEMREKKGRTETEEERRQRLSIHMDEIVNGNITAAMEIFDNLRKQEELQSILSRVEEIEKDTCELDVRSLRGVFENVSSNPNKHKRVKEENREERMPMMRDNDESKSSMAHVFGDLERASEEIMALKEQTLARLVDIEEAIKKALFSVSTLKSDSDITSLSCLFKESLATVQESPSSANISKISIGSSTTKPVQKSPAVQENTALPGSQQQTSPPSSPAFISIQSASRQMDKTEVFPTGTNVCTTCQHGLKTEETFRTTKMLTCNSLAQNTKQDPRTGGQKQCSYTPKRELSVLEVLTNHEGKSITGTKTVTENYERTDNFGNRFYSSKTSTVIQPETATSVGQAVVSPVTYQINTYPDVLLPINQKL